MFKSRSGSNTIGIVFLATQLDSNDPDFTSKQEMMAYAGAANTNMWLDMVHNCLMVRGDYMKKYFVRTGPLSSGQDSQLYDAGKFTWACVCNTANTFAGELYVEYEVELFNPKMNIAAVGANLQLKSFPLDDTNPFQNAVPDGNWMPNEKYITTDSKGGVTFQQAGLYRLDLTSTSGALTGATVVVGPDVSIYDDGSILCEGAGGVGNFAWNAYLLVGKALTGIQFLTDFFAGAETFLSVVQVPLAAAATMLGVFGAADQESCDRLRKRYPKLKFGIYSGPKRAVRVERKEGKTRKIPSLAADLIQPQGLAIRNESGSVSVVRKPLGRVPAVPSASGSCEGEEPY